MNIIERAYELAKSGSCRSVQDIASALKREGYSSVDAHLHGSSIRKSLTALLGARKAATVTADAPEHA